MVIREHVRKDHGRTGKRFLLECSTCGVEIKVGDTYYIRKSSGRNMSNKPPIANKVAVALIE